MAKITRKRLSTIIKEELEAVIVDEGLVDTFRALGSGLKKFYKDAEVTGEIEASKRATQAVGNQLTDRRDRFKAALDRETDPNRKAKIEQEINTLNAMIDGLGRGGEKAKEIHTALADASDGKVEDSEWAEFDTSYEKSMAMLDKKKNQGEKSKGNGAGGALKKAAGVDARKWNFKTNPEGIVDIIIKSIAELNLNSSSAITKDGIGGINDKQKAALLNRIGINSQKASGEARVAAARAKGGQLEEGLLQSIKIPRSTLREILHIIQEK